jgi:hypothetical protein
MLVAEVPPECRSWRQYEAFDGAGLGCVREMTRNFGDRSGRISRSPAPIPTIFVSVSESQALRRFFEFREVVANERH